MGGKWLELLKEIAPQVTRAALLFSPKTAPYAQDYLRQFELAGRSFSVDTIAAPVRDRTENRTRDGRAGARTQRWSGRAE
jgi:putative ABC transport system substrate-binding protein